MRRSSVPLLLLMAVLGAAAAPPLSAQPWPARTLRIVTGTPAGGSPDFIGRLLAERLSERLGQTVLVENSATTGVAAWSAIAKSPPDGSVVTLLTGAFSARAAVAKALPYDPIRDFTFITMVSGYPMVVATAPGSPIRSFPELIARAKAAPFSITYGMNLPGSVHHLTGELINVEAGLSMRGIPYRGNSQIVQDLLGGRLDVMLETGTVAFAQIRSGTIRGLAVSSRERFVLQPEIPAIGETLPGFEVMSWLGLAAPPGLPAAMVERLNREVGEILRLPAVHEKFSAMDILLSPGTPEALAERVRSEIPMFAKVAREAGIEPE
jgi:tripartite-type tricarboxylate transporter receptor subunit TctC